MYVWPFSQELFPPCLASFVMEFSRPSRSGEDFRSLPPRSDANNTIPKTTTTTTTGYSNILGLADSNSGLYINQNRQDFSQEAHISSYTSSAPPSSSTTLPATYPYRSQSPNITSSQWEEYRRQTPNAPVLRVAPAQDYPHRDSSLPSTEPTMR